MSFNKFHDFTFIAKDKYQVILSFFVFVGYWEFYYLIIERVFSFFDSLNMNSENQNNNDNSIISSIKENVFLWSFVGLCFFWILFSFTFLPINIQWDGRRQLLQFYGVESLNMHHPIVGTYLMGCLYNLGFYFAGYKGACIIYYLFQIAFASFVFAQIIEYVFEKTDRFFCALLAFLYFALLPEFWGYVSTIIKDTIYFVLFAYLTLEIVKYIFDEASLKRFILIAVLTLLSCQIRGDAIIRTLPILVLMPLLLKTKKQKIMILCLALFTFMFTQVTMKILNIHNNPDVRAERDFVEYQRLKVQTLARFVKYYGSEISEEEKKVIDKVLIYDALAKNYNPENSDVWINKHRKVKDITKNDLKNFNKLWLKFFVMHPTCYFEAILNHCYGYFYPFTNVQRGNLLKIQQPFGVHDKNIQFSEYFFPEKNRESLKEYDLLWQKLPLFGLFEFSGFYTFIGIFLVAFLIRKKQFKYLVFFVAPFLTIAICMGCGIINNLIRYMLPVMACMPLYVMLGLLPCLKGGEKKLLNNNGDL